MIKAVNAGATIAENPLADINRSGLIEPIDALIVINAINSGALLKDPFSASEAFDSDDDLPDDSAALDDLFQGGLGVLNYTSERLALDPSSEESVSTPWQAKSFLPTELSALYRSAEGEGSSSSSSSSSSTCSGTATASTSSTYVPASFVVSSVTVNENSDAVFSISPEANGQSHCRVSVSWSVNHMSTDGSDLVSTSGTLSFRPIDIYYGVGQAVAVPLIDDGFIDNPTSPSTSEQFSLVAVWTPEATVATPSPTPVTVSGTGSIIDNDGEVRITTNLIERSEGTEAPASASYLNIYEFNVEFRGNSPDGFDLRWKGNYGQTNSIDLYGIGDIIHFEGDDGESHPIKVYVRSDNIVELNEEFTVELVEVLNHQGNVLVDTTQSTGRILNNDSAIVSLEYPNGPLSEPHTAQMFKVLLSNPVDVDVTVDFESLKDDPVSAGDGDFQIKSEAVVLKASDQLAPSASFNQIWVSITNDSIIEADETFLARISSLAAGGRDVEFNVENPEVTATIKDNDEGFLVISAASTSVAENAGPFSFDVKLVDAFGAPLTSELSIPFTFSTANGSATGGEDFIAANAVTGSVGSNTITITNDNIVEVNETFSVSIALDGAPPAVKLGTSSLTVAITNNEDSAVISISNATALEGHDLDFVITISNPIARNVSFKVRAGGGDATIGVDYFDFGALTRSFAAGGALSFTFSVHANPDSVTDDHETFELELYELDADGLNVSLGTATGTGTIIDNP